MHGVMVAHANGALISEMLPLIARQRPATSLAGFS
jgi:hypothetical protein